MSNTFVEKVRGGIIVSCQAKPGDPTYGSEMMSAFALSAKIGGAVGIRASSDIDVAAIKQATGLPIIGIWKRPPLDEHIHIITPTVEDARLLKEAGADVVALDVTDRPRPGGLDAVTLIKRIKEEVGIPLMADCATLQDAIRAQEAGVEIASTTLSFPPELGPYQPNLKLLDEMIRTLRIPVIAEGHYWNTQDVQKAFELGVTAVVIGSAITRPWLITERYVRCIPCIKDS